MFAVNMVRTRNTAIEADAFYSSHVYYEELGSPNRLLTFPFNLSPG